MCAVFNNLENIDAKKWIGLKSIIKIDRKVVCKGKTTKETAYFISSLSSKTGAEAFNEGIRGHWNIESFHYIKDVIFGEDKSKIKTKNAPCNYSIIRNLVINMFRKNNLNKIQETIEKCAKCRSGRKYFNFANCVGRIIKRAFKGYLIYGKIYNFIKIKKAREIPSRTPQVF